MIKHSRLHNVKVFSPFCFQSCPATSPASPILTSQVLLLSRRPNATQVVKLLSRNKQPCLLSHYLAGVTSPSSVSLALPPRHCALPRSINTAGRDTGNPGFSISWTFLELHDTDRRALSPRCSLDASHFLDLHSKCSCMQFLSGVFRENAVICTPWLPIETKPAWVWGCSLNTKISLQRKHV